MIRRDQTLARAVVTILLGHYVRYMKNDCPVSRYSACESEYGGDLGRVVVSNQWCCCSFSTKSHLTPYSISNETKVTISVTSVEQSQAENTCVRALLLFSFLPLQRAVPVLSKQKFTCCA